MEGETSRRTGGERHICSESGDALKICAWHVENRKWPSDRQRRCFQSGSSAAVWESLRAGDDLFEIDMTVRYQVEGIYFG